LDVSPGNAIDTDEHPEIKFYPGQLSANNTSDLCPVLYSNMYIYNYKYLTLTF